MRVFNEMEKATEHQQDTQEHVAASSSDSGCLVEGNFRVKQTLVQMQCGDGET